MENLRKFMLIIAISLVSFTSNFAQNSSQEIIDAFAESYELEKNGEYAKAISSLKSVYDENSYEINLRLGWLSYSVGSFTQSIAYYNNAIDLMPYSIEAKFGMIYPVYAIGRTTQVISLYNEILDIAPKNYTALYNLGSIYYYAGRYNEALPLFQKLVDLFPFDYDALLMYAWTNLMLNKYREATILFNKVLMNTPNDESALEGLGMIP